MKLRCGSYGPVDGVINFVGSRGVWTYIRDNSGETSLDRWNERGNAGRSVTAVDTQLGLSRQRDDFL
jgi:hypothetical protein